MTEVDGFLVTGIERTVVDVARWLPYEDAVAVVGEVDARVDFDWDEFGVCGEFDGWTKYGRLLKPGQSVEQVIVFEKQREELLRTHDRWTVRWNTTNLKSPEHFRRIIEGGFRNGPKGTWPRR